MAEKVTKAQLVRNYLIKHPDIESPTKLANLINEENKGANVSPQLVSTMRTKVSPPPTPGLSVPQIIAALKVIVGQVGKEDTKKIVDAL